MKRAFGYCTMLCLFVLILAGGLLLFSQPACAESSGTWGNLKWTLDDEGLLTISGSGGMNAFSFESSSAWQRYIDSIKSVEIEDGVTSIGDDAFYGCSSLASITIPDSVTSIGYGAFRYCSSLTSITIPDSVTSIGEWAFSGCRSLTGITIPEGVTSIGYGAFSNCSNLTSITIPDSVTSIGNSAFYYCRSLTGITIPEGVTSIGDFAFHNCSSLTGITIPDSVTSIGWDAFSDCRSLTGFVVDENNAFFSVKGGVLFNNGMSILTCFPGGRKEENYIVPNSVTNIGNSAFRGCSNLKSITIPDSVTSIGEYAFYGCISLTSITIPDSVTSIGSLAFSGCSSLTSITIPEGVTSIGTAAFWDCRSLTSIKIPDSVTSIGENAFIGCSRLTSITIPDGVTSIGDSAFYKCSSLTGVEILSQTTSFGTSVFSNSPTVYCYEYSDADGWATDKGYSVIYLDGLDANAIRTVSLPDDFMLPSGKSSRIGATVFPTFDDPELIWSNSDPSIVAFDNGTVTGLKPGTATITATVGAVSDSVTVTVYTPAESFDLNVTEVWLVAKEPLQLSAINVLPEGAEALLTWRSSDTTLATVSESGLVTTKKPGDVTITVISDNGISRSCLLHLSAGSFDLNETEVWLLAKESLQLTTINVQPEGAETVFTWSSSDTTLATVSESGLVTTKKPGDVTITVTSDNGISRSCLLHLSAGSFDLNETEIWLVAKEPLQLSAINVQPEGAETAFTWSSSDTSYATVDESGLVTTKKPGDVTITATSDNGVSRSCLLHLCYPVTAIAFDPEALELKTGQTFPLTANVTMRTQSCFNHLVTFESSDEAVATVDADGMVTAHGVGTATITATAASGVSASCAITVRDAYTLTLPAGLTAIEAEAFMGDASLEAVIVPEGCASIGSRAFAGCANLYYVRVPAGTSIASDAFEGCDNVIIERVG